MYPLGHLGTGLLLVAPVAALQQPRTLTGLTMVTLFAALLPDLDLYLPYVTHHGITHSIGFAVGLGVVGGLLAAGTIAVLQDHTDVIDAGRFSPRRVLLYVGLGLFIGVVSHVVADLLVTLPGTEPVSAFWPLSDRTLEIRAVPLGAPLRNAILIAAGLGVHALVSRHAERVTRYAAPGAD